MVEDKPDGSLEWVDVPNRNSKAKWLHVFGGAVVGVILAILTGAYRHGGWWQAVMVTSFGAGLGAIGPRVDRFSQQRVEVTDKYVRSYLGEAMQWHLAWSRLRDVAVFEPKRLLGISLTPPTIRFHARAGEVYTVPLPCANHRSAYQLAERLRARLRSTAENEPACPPPCIRQRNAL